MALPSSAGLRIGQRASPSFSRVLVLDLLQEDPAGSRLVMAGRTIGNCHASVGLVLTGMHLSQHGHIGPAICPLQSWRRHGCSLVISLQQATAGSPADMTASTSFVWMERGHRGLHGEASFDVAAFGRLLVKKCTPLYVLDQPGCHALGKGWFQLEAQQDGFGHSCALASWLHRRGGLHFRDTGSL